MAAKRQKPAEQRVFKRPSRETAKVALVPNADERVTPRCPANLHTVAQRWWKELWQSPLAQVIDLDADGDAIRRWAYCISEREQLEEEIREQPMVRGSQGQLVRNPLFDILKERVREIEKYREHYGGTALSRMRLGIAYSEADAALERMQQRRKRFEPVMVEIAGVDDDADVIEVGT